MLSSLTIQFIICVIIIGLIGLIPVIIINRRSNKIDKSMYDNKIDIIKDLDAFKTDTDEKNIDTENKLKKFKQKD